MEPQVSLIVEPDLLLESEATVSLLKISLSEPPPASGIVVRLNAPNLSEFDLSEAQIEGGQITLEKEFEQQLQDALNRTRAAEIPGAAIAIVSPFGSWFGASGVADLENNTPLQSSDRFQIGSITKTFVATTALQLVEEGLLSLDDTLNTWLPESLTADIPHAEDITLKNLLQHTSGVADALDVLFTQAMTNPAVFLQDWQPEQLIDLIDGVAPSFAPGESWEYSNTNFILAGLIIEAATGNNIAQEIRDRILTPLNLNNTFFAGEEDIPGGFVDGYWDFDQNGTLDNLTDVPLSWAWAAGAMVSNTEDLDKFARSLFKGELLEPQTLAQMLDTTSTLNSPNYDSYGLGVGTIESPNRFWYIHRGQTLGYRSNMWYSPQDDLTYIELINGFSRDNLSGDLLPPFRQGIADDRFNVTLTEQTAQIRLPIADDGEIEGEETATFTLVAGDGYTIDPDARAGTLTIIDTPIADGDEGQFTGTVEDDEFNAGVSPEGFNGSNDYVFAGVGDDLLDTSNGLGNNRLYGQSGDDTLFLGSNDRAFGGAGDDTFYFLGSDSTISGGSEADQFWIALAEYPESANTITDFESGVDILGIGGLGLSFKDLTLTQQGGNTLISAQSQEIATLLGINSNQLSADDFTFI